MLIKVCGMRNGENISDVEKLGIDFMGFIFYAKSPRYVSQLPDYLPVNCKRVGVFVNEKTSKIVEIAAEFSLDYLQLHGSESPEQCSELKNLGYKIIKVFSVGVTQDFANIDAYEPYCEYLLFDTSCSGYGGSGKSFNWELMADYKGVTPFLLSGGLSLESLDTVKKFSHPRFAGLDLNSGFEIEPAHKNTSLLKTFIINIKHHE